MATQTALFPVGRVVATPTAVSEIPNEEIQSALRRHHTGDWGDLSQGDKDLNDLAIADGDRILSAYHSQSGLKFYIITEWDRSVTTVLLANEY